MPGHAITRAGLILAGYLLGSIPFGLILGKLFGGTDVRGSGSGNIGAANVARVVGAGAGVLTLLLDAAKGSLAVWLAERLANASAAWMMAAGAAALLGHCFPVWLRFKGGKGVATAAGIYAVICPLAALFAIVLFLFVVAFWRYVSLGSIAAVAAMPLLLYFFWAPPHALPLSVTIDTFLIAVVIVWKHDANLQRLWKGDEPRFVFRRKDGADK